MIKQSCTFKNLEEILKDLEEIQKTWKILDKTILVNLRIFFIKFYVNILAIL